MVADKIVEVDNPFKINFCHLCELLPFSIKPFGGSRQMNSNIPLFIPVLK